MQIRQPRERSRRICLAGTSPTAQDCAASPTEHLFTQKERDAETGNDYFGARYYASSTGRFLTPDWSAKDEPVPYSKLDDPQTLNLYAYVGNNPFIRIDADGHQTGQDSGCAKASGGSNGVCNAEAKAETAKKGSTTDRLIAGVAGAANLYVAANKAVETVAAAAATPETGGLAGTAAVYEGYQTAGQAAVAITQLKGAITGNTEQANSEADNITIHTSAVAMVTLAVTKNKTMAVNSAALEGIASSSVTKAVFKSAASVIDNVMNFLQVTFGAKPPEPSHP